MVFSNLFFLFVFLPLNLVIYYSVPNIKTKNLVLVITSLIFYAWGEPVWVLLLVLSATADYVLGLIIEANRGLPKSRFALISSLVLNISLLAFFKYYGFVIENLNALLNTSFAVIDFGLPIGISFYTFQSVSYIIDVYRGEVKAQRSYLNFLLFISLFHQLVAGPIVRYKDIAKDIENRQVTKERFNYGIIRFTTGLGKKVIFANTAGEIAGFFLDGSFSELSVAGAWFGISLFALQIYFDFSGYSDMAIGLGHMFGFTYLENFNYPYISKSATEFWRRWHMSLGSFFRDYVYIPLGGNRRRALFNLMVVWFLTGLWHGASWNFVFWGLYFGILIGVEKKFLLDLFARIPVIFSHLYLTVVVLVGWVLFYFVDLSRALEYLSIMFGLINAPLYTVDTGIRFMNNVYFYLVALLFCTPVIKWFYPKLQGKNTYHVFQIEFIQLAYVCLVLVMSSALLVNQSYNPFLYFRF